MANPGKVFEEDFRQSAKLFPQIDTNRQNDPIGGQAGVRNICDYIVYRYPYNHYFELKSRQGNTLNFKEITSTQWLGMLEKSTIKGNIAGVIVNYSDHNEVYFVPITTLAQLRDEQGKKSLHINDAREKGLQVPGQRKRTRYTYDIDTFLQQAGELYGRS